MRPEDFHDAAKLRSMVMYMMEARAGMIFGGRVLLEHAANHLNQIAALYERHITKLRETEILKAAGVTRAPPPTMSASVGDAAAKKRKTKSTDDD